jgi:alcohol dehydrogenase, propanol-preferring
VPIPVPAPGEVRIAMRACGICGSDLKMINGKLGAAFLPIILGHEPAGIIDATGDGVDDVHVGQRVLVNAMWACGTCRTCLAGQPNLCLSGRSMGVGANGAHADFFLAPASNVVPLPENVDFVTGAVVTDSLATPMHSIRRSGVQPGQTAAVFGLGGLGLHAAMILESVLGVRVIGIDVYDGALSRAPSHGVSDVVDGRSGDVYQQVRRLSDGGVDVSFDFVGAPSVVDTALRSLRHGGTCVAVGSSPDHLALRTRQQTIVAKELTLKGSLGYLTCDIAELVGMVADKQLRVSVSHTFGLDNYTDGIETLRDPDANPTRVVITSDVGLSPPA